MLVEYRDTRHTFAVVVCGTDGDSHIFKSTSDELGRINRTHITLLILVRRFYTAPTHQLGVFFDVILGAGCFAFGLLLRNHRWSWKTPLITRKVEENPRSSVAVSHFLLNYYSIYIYILLCLYNTYWAISFSLFYFPYVLLSGTLPATILCIHVIVWTKAAFPCDGILGTTWFTYLDS